MEALEHQKAALGEITTRARTYYALSDNKWGNLPIQPRWATILCAPTGTGKTALAVMAARAVGASMLRVSAPSWMPCGAHQRGAKETISVIAEHVARNDRTLLVVDEIDKLIATNSDSWQGYIRGEIYDLLDGRWPTGLREVEDNDDNEIPTAELTAKLKDSVFVLSIGTFQNWFDASHQRRAIGFGDGSDAKNKELSAELIADMMPRELANRHNSSIVRLPELQAEDYRHIAQETINKLPQYLQAPFRREVDRQIDGAITAKKGVRFLEEAMMFALIGLRNSAILTLDHTEEKKLNTNIETCTL